MALDTISKCGSESTARGRVAVMDEGFAGPEPAHVKAHMGAIQSAVDRVKELAAVGASEPSPATAAASGPPGLEGSDHLASWRPYGDRGFYVYEWDGYDEAPYEQRLSPSNPVEVGSLPDDLRLAGRFIHLDADFTTGDDLGFEYVDSPTTADVENVVPVPGAPAQQGDATPDVRLEQSFILKAGPASRVHVTNPSATTRSYRVHSDVIGLDGARLAMGFCPLLVGPHKSEDSYFNYFHAFDTAAARVVLRDAQYKTGVRTAILGEWR